ncbi:MAG: methyltransferase domain-containing protein [Lachnospiraceae bacterium]
MKIREQFYRWKRYFIFALQYYLLEKPRGLDFTMRDMEIPEGNDALAHGYSKTNEKHLRDIFQKLPFEDELSILDIGCGKGVVLKEAAKYPFHKIGGIDLNTSLVKIAQKNLRKLHLDQRVSCEEVNALEYKGYGDYNVFFFFNPFPEDVLAKVLDRIIEKTRENGKGICIIYHNPLFHHIVEAKGIFALENKLYDSLKQYETYIYTSHVG